MTLPVNLVSPHIPRYPWAGGVAGGKAIFVHAPQAGGSGDGVFSVVDPSGSVRVFNFSPPAGYYGQQARFGAPYGGGVLVALAGMSDTAGSLWMAHFFPDGTVDAYPSPFTWDGGSVVVAGTKAWAFSPSASTLAPRIFDLSTMTWDTSTAPGTVTVTAEPVYLGGDIWVRATDSNWWKYDPVTKARTGVSGTTPPSSARQVAKHPDGNAYWTTSNTTVLQLTPGGTSTVFTPGPNSFGYGLCVDPDGFLRSHDSTGATACAWNPVTGETWQESTGLTGGSNCQLSFTAGSKVITGVWKA